MLESRTHSYLSRCSQIHVHRLVHTCMFKILAYKYTQREEKKKHKHTFIKERASERERKTINQFLWANESKLVVCVFGSFFVAMNVTSAKANVVEDVFEVKIDFRSSKNQRASDTRYFSLFLHIYTCALSIDSCPIFITDTECVLNATEMLRERERERKRLSMASHNTLVFFFTVCRTHIVRVKYEVRRKCTHTHA